MGGSHDRAAHRVRSRGPAVRGASVRGSAVRGSAVRRRTVPATGLAALAIFAGACAGLPWNRSDTDWADRGPDPAEYRRLVEAQQTRYTPPPDAQPTGSKVRSDSGSDSDATLADKLQRGDQLRDAGEPEKALWTYLEAYRMDPEAPAPRVRIAYLHLREEPARAQGIFEEVLEETPDHAGAQLGLGLALLSRERVDDARTALERAVELAPDSSDALAALGTVYDRSGRHAEAQQHFRAALEQRSDDPRLLNNLGVSYLMSRDLEQAESVLREAVALSPRDPALRNNLGLALGLLGRYDAALAEFREAGGEQAAQNNLGYVYFLNGRYDDAAAHYEQALLADGDDDVTVLENLHAMRDQRRRAAEAGRVQPSQASRAE